MREPALPRIGIWPIRQQSAGGTPAPRSRFERVCEQCGASMVRLAPGTTGHRGLWDGWRWWCSTECHALR